MPAPVCQIEMKIQARVLALLSQRLVCLRDHQRVGKTRVYTLRPKA